MQWGCGAALGTSAALGVRVYIHYLGNGCYWFRSYSGLIADLIDAACAYPCGSGLARESGGSANLTVCWADAFASKSNRRTAAPTFYLRCFENFVHLTDRYQGKPALTEKQKHRQRIYDAKRVALDLDLRCPVKPRWPNAGLNPWVTRQDAGLAALGHGWPIAAVA